MSLEDKFEELQSEISELESRAILLYIDNVDMDKAIKREEIEKYLIDNNSEIGKIATTRIFSIKIEKNLEITILSVIDSDFIGSLIQTILDYIIEKEMVYSEITIKFV